MLKFDEQKQFDSVNGALALRGEIEAVVDKLCDEPYTGLYFMGIGGTYASAMQVVTYLEGNSALPAYTVNAAEYITNGNRRIGKGSIVIFSSVTGKTEEMLKGIQIAKENGAVIFGFIDEKDTPLTEFCDYVVSYPANEQLKFFMVAHRFMLLHGDFEEYARYYKEMDQHLAKALVEVGKASDKFGETFALAHKDDPIHYFIGAGSQWGSTYSYAMCYWEEQHWLRTKSIHAGEFFHGTLEIIERDVPVTVFIGEDKERLLCERVANFLPRITNHFTIIDTKDYKLEGISQKFRGSISHLVLRAVTARIDVYIEKFNCHPMEIRRYYRKLDY